MPVLTAGYPLPPHICVNDEKQIKELFSVTANLQDWAVALVDELRYILCNLDAGNVSEAQSVKAEHIDTRTARIQSAQIQSLKADKIKTGVLHVTEKMTIQNGDGSIQFLPDSIVMSTPYVDENGAYHVDEEGNPVMVPRLQMGRIAGTNTFIFTINDKYGKPTLMLNDDGEGIFGGEIRTKKDCYISGELRVGLDAKADNSRNGISFYGDALTGGSKLYAKLVPYMADDEHIGVNVTDGGLYEDGKKVLTTNDYGALQSQITSLKNEIKDLKDQIADLKGI